ncbi:MAG TPA: hypothetical protein VGE74_29980 [Gemmata sp.]
MAKVKRGKLFFALVRRNLTTSLVRDHGYDRTDAAELVASLTDAQIDAQADQRKVGAIGDGGFLAWLVDHLDEIRALVEFFAGLFALVATPAVVAARAPADQPAAV